MAKMNGMDQGAAAQARDDYSLMPECDVIAQMTESDIKENSKKTGDVLASVFTVIYPDEFKGRKLFGNINVRHNSAEAQRIGQIELANLKAAIGLQNTQIQDTLQLHNKPMGLHIKIELGNGQFKDKNVIFDYFPADQYQDRNPNGHTAAPVPAPAPAPAAAAPTPPPAPAPAANKAPWLRKAA
jgi:hypothetical protein